MNLVNTFARIRAAFKTRPATKIRVVDVNEHMKRDLGLYNINSDRRVAERAPRTEVFVVYGAVTRAP
jgi:hypothetical protein